mmetsp:Transcript_16472/g.31220  ORF Transcript_16472/g.31220 Transcript_16472/m.31220 type:complete len:1192 (-) Transcript_16472:3011-6586(-)
MPMLLESIDGKNQHYRSSRINSTDVVGTPKSIDEEEQQIVPRPSDLPWKKPTLAATKFFRRVKRDGKKFSFVRSGKQKSKKAHKGSVLNKRLVSYNQALEQDEEYQGEDHNHQSSSPLLGTCFSNLGEYSSLNYSPDSTLSKQYRNDYRPRSLSLNEYSDQSDNENSSDDDISYDSSTHSHSARNRLMAKEEVILCTIDKRDNLEKHPENEVVEENHRSREDFHIRPVDYSMRRPIRRLLRCITHNAVSKCLLRIPTLADALPPPATLILHNPKMSFGAFIVACMVLDLFIILPGYLFSFIITEVGVYFAILFCIWNIGRFVLRMITFPGSTSRLKGDIESEFTKYSIRMLENAAEAIMEVAMVMASMEEVTMHGGHNGVKFVDGVNGRAVRLIGKKSIAPRELYALWNKVCQYRDRVLGMYYDVLHCLLLEEGQGSGEKTKYGNNPLVGDIGNLVDISCRAKSDGDRLMKALKKVLEDLESLDAVAGNYLRDSKQSHTHVLKGSTRAAQRLLVSTAELAESLSFLRSSMKKSPEVDIDHEFDEDESQDSDFEANHKSFLREVFENIKTALSSLLDILDPPPHESIFGLDTLRGAVLSRYHGSRQLWIERPRSLGGGKIDALHIPADGMYKSKTCHDRMKKCVLFCNPNAGLLEVATGISLISGNVSTSTASEVSCWTDYYLAEGYDIVLFNYTGFGRSHRGSQQSKNSFSRGPGVICRIITSVVSGFKPSPSSLKLDATTIATHIIEKIGVDKFIIHGESIGGMAAAGAANVISQRQYLDVESHPVVYPTLLIGDRTFCNLNATACRLVGNWTRFVIPFLTPFWDTNVARDFTAARCKKLVAQDAADSIIHDSSSLKKGIATAQEYTKRQTKASCAPGQVPLPYRMAEYEDVGVQESKFARFPSSSRLKVPSWPTDKHIDISEAIHFAACARRIGKVATNIRKNKIFNFPKPSQYDDEEEGIEITAVFSRDVDTNDDEEHEYDAILHVWDNLSLCDGLTGLCLGAAVKDGYDSTIDWLSGICTLGCQRVALAAESRQKVNNAHNIPFDRFVVEDQDFNSSQSDIYSRINSEEVSLPLPYVIDALQAMLQSCDSFPAEESPIKKVRNELDYCLNMLLYIKKRLASEYSVKNALACAHFREVFDDFSTGRFLNLRCGHNNQYSVQERIELTLILTEATDEGPAKRKPIIEIT